MFRPRSLTPALVASATLLLPVALPGAAVADDGGPGAAPAVPSTAVGKPLGVGVATTPTLSRPALRAVRRAAAGSPLAITIDSLTPSVLPETGPVVVTGTVTNVDDEPWRAINLYASFLGEPITTRAGLADATASKVSTPVGERIVLEDPATSAKIDELSPGESAHYGFYVPRTELTSLDPATGVSKPVSKPGIYWFGVQAVGEADDSPRKDQTGATLADGRARTFLPLVPPGRTPVRTALVLPIRREVTFTPDGRVADLAGWTSTFGAGGHLRSLVDLGAAAGGRDVSWLVDPSVVDAARRLAAGNPARSLAPTLPPDVTTKPSATPSAAETPLVPLVARSGSAPPSPGSSGEASGESTDGSTQDPAPPDPSTLDPETRAAAAAADQWLDRLHSALQGQEILALPYGDPDVAAAAAHAPELYDLARRRSGTLLAPWGLATHPAIASPSGFIDGGAVEMTAPGSTILVTDRAFPATPKDPPADPRTPSVVSAAGHTLVVTSAAAAAGGPGPGDPRALLALRQQVLAEAALRAIRPGARPMTVLLPPDWTPDDATGLPMQGFWDGLDVGWLDLAPVDGPGGVAESPATPVGLDELAYPERQADDQLDATSFEAAHALIRAGATLQDILLRNDQVAGQITDQALASTSYSARRHAATTSATALATKVWVDSRLEQVGVRASSVILSSSSGRFAVTMLNDLDESVSVRLAIESDPDVSVEVPARIDIPAHGRRSVPLEAVTTRDGVHRVTLVVTDSQGRRLPSPDPVQIQIRSAEVSRLIWLALALGAVLLFGTLALRVVRRVRAAGRT